MLCIFLTQIPDTDMPHSLPNKPHFVATFSYVHRHTYPFLCLRTLRSVCFIYFCSFFFLVGPFALQLNSLDVLPSATFWTSHGHRCVPFSPPRYVPSFPLFSFLCSPIASNVHEQVMNTPLEPIPQAAIFSTVQRMQKFSNWSVTCSWDMVYDEKKMKIHSSYEIEDFVETRLCQLCVILRPRALLAVRPH